MKHAAHTVFACYLGWMLDAFDFFMLTQVIDDIAHEFSASRTTVTSALLLTLALRPLGAFLFGRAADRFGRRPTLMIDVVLYSLFAFASGFAPSLTWFLVLRALFGVAMGGEWGVGAALTMETIPPSWRGLVSGLLQAGYPSGFLLSTVVYHALYGAVGWRGLMMTGAIPALLILYIRRSVPDSRPATAAPAGGRFWAQLGGQWRLALFAVAMMALFNFFSHGTQDLYPTFLRADHRFAGGQVTAILITMNLAAMLGGLSCGLLSQHFGRRRVIALAALAAVPVVPLWAFASTPVAIGAGAFLIQLCVQGAWGIVPAHLNEISPPAMRATFPGFTYQLGNLLAASTATLQSGLASHFFGNRLAWPLALMTGLVALLLSAIVGVGPEARTGQIGGDRDPLHK